MRTQATLVSPDSQFISAAQESSRSPIQFPHPCIMTRKFKGVNGITSFISHRSGIILCHCLISSALKTIWLKYFVWFHLLKDVTPCWPEIIYIQFKSIKNTIFFSRIQINNCMTNERSYI